MSTATLPLGDGKGGQRSRGLDQLDGIMSGVFPPGVIIQPDHAP